jgi:hypothetical protein
MTTATAPATSSARAALQTARPLISLSATWVVRKGLMRGYEARTGKAAPVVYNREASLLAKVLWSATMAATIALVEVVLWQLLDSDED